MADLSHGLNQRRDVVAPAGPVRGLPDVEIITAIHAAIMVLIHRTDKLFTAKTAGNPKEEPTVSGGEGDPRL